MKKFLFFIVAMLGLALCLPNLKAANVEAGLVPTQKLTAVSVWNDAKTLDQSDPENVKALKAEIKKLSIRERIKLAKMAYYDAVRAGLTPDQKPGVGLYILAVIIPPLAVGIYTHWKIPTLYNFLWLTLGGLPAVVHAFIVLSR